jgi:hypothetical protein
LRSSSSKALHIRASRVLSEPKALRKSTIGQKSLACGVGRPFPSIARFRDRLNRGSGIRANQEVAMITRIAASICAALLAGTVSSPVAAQKGDRPQTSAVYKLIGAGLALRYEAAACGVVLTAEQTEAITTKLDALTKKASASSAEIAGYKAQIKAKIDPLIEANANFCTTITRSVPSYITSFVAERPTAEWEDAAQTDSGGSTTLVGGWTVDTHDCTITYASKDAGDHVSGIFLGKVQGAVAVTLQRDDWDFAADAVVPAKTLIDDIALAPLVAWHAAKQGPYLAAVFPAASLPRFSRAAAISMVFARADASPAIFATPGIAEAIGALDGCGQ